MAVAVVSKKCLRFMCKILERKPINYRKRNSGKNPTFFFYISASPKHRSGAWLSIVKN